MVVGHHVGVVHAPSFRLWLNALAVYEDVLVVEAIGLAGEFINLLINVSWPLVRGLTAWHCAT